MHAGFICKKLRWQTLQMEQGISSSRITWKVINFGIDRTHWCELTKFDRLRWHGGCGKNPLANVYAHSLNQLGYEISWCHWRETTSRHQRQRFHLDISSMILKFKNLGFFYNILKALSPRMCFRTFQMILELPAIDTSVNKHYFNGLF